MKQNISAVCATLALAVILPALAFSQGIVKTLVLAGYKGTVPVKEIHGKDYVEIGALARIADGSVSFHGDQVTLTLPTPETVASTAPPEANDRFSREFLRAWIEEMSTIREWHTVLENGITNQTPIWQSWLGPFESRATTSLQLVQVTAATDADRSAAQLIANDYEKMKQLQDNYLARAKSANYIAPDSLASDALDQSLLACGQSLEAMAARGRFLDDGACD